MAKEQSVWDLLTVQERAWILGDKNTKEDAELANRGDLITFLTVKYAQAGYQYYKVREMSERLMTPEMRKG